MEPFRRLGEMAPSLEVRFRAPQLRARGILSTPGMFDFTIPGKGCSSVR